MTDEPHEGHDEFSLECPFLTDDPMFARGVEVGMLVERMGHEDEIADLFQLENQEQILLLANRKKWKVEKVESIETPGWFALVMTRR